MTSGLAPPVIPSVRTGTPPKEWSESVFASSPARETPARPSEVEESKETTGVPESKPTTATRDQQSLGATVAQAAKQYMPEQVGKAVDYATQTAAAAASYLPDPQSIKGTVSSYLSSEQPTPEAERRISLPSTELRGAQPSESTGGVGALPGNLSESSVALLPDERQERDRERKERDQERRSSDPLRQRRDTIKPSRAFGDDEDNLLVSQTSDEPSTSTGGIAAETAKSGPEAASQKEASETEGQQAGSEISQAAGMAGTTPSDEEMEKSVGEDVGSTIASETPGEPKGPSKDVQEGDKEGETTVPKEVKGGYGGEYHPAQLHPPPPGASAAEYQGSLGTQQEEPNSPTTGTAKATSAGAQTKPRFMTVVKGEMKILAGKMSGDEHRVEEGRKIVHGDA